MQTSEIFVLKLATQVNGVRKMGLGSGHRSSDRGGARRRVETSSLVGGLGSRKIYG